MKCSDRFVLPDPPPWSQASGAADLLVAPVVPGRHPCGDCLAMCCWFLPLERGRVESRADLDALDDLLAYERMSLWLEPQTGAYSVGLVTPCRLLARDTCGCSVHGTTAQPRLCREFDADSCWYRRRFEAGDGAEAIRLDGSTWPSYRAGLPADLTPPLNRPSPYELTRVPVRYDVPVILDLDVPADSAPSEDHLADLLVFLANFEPVYLVRTASEWRLRIPSRRLNGRVATALEEPSDTDLPCWPLDSERLKRAHQQLGPGLWQATPAQLRVIS